VIRFSIRRPVAVTMAYSAVAALGAFAWSNIPIELIPDTQLPRLTVNASWRGASPETVEAFLTSPLEAEIQQVKGVEKITSTSSEQQGMGTSVITVEFGRDVDMDFARLELSERISTLEEDLPQGVGVVQVQPYIPDELRDQATAFLRYNFTGPYTLEALRAHIDDVVKPALSEIEGVGVVRVMGGRARRLEIRLDPEASRSLGLSPVFLRQRIAELDLIQEAGVVREGDREWTVTIANRPTSPDDILDAIVATVGAKPVRVRDVAGISDTYEEALEYRRIGGEPSVTFDVIKEIGTNTVAVGDRVKAAMARLEGLAPYGSTYQLVERTRARTSAASSRTCARAPAARRS
jgi:HAE1 family hydrophobic/amphiphilic exporter-1